MTEAILLGGGSLVFLILIVIPVVGLKRRGSS
jgi:hypothetical protein